MYIYGCSFKTFPVLKEPLCSSESGLLPYRKKRSHAILLFVKVLLIGINAKFIQTNLAIRLLDAYIQKWLPAPVRNEITVQCCEWNINQSISVILQGIFTAKPDVVLFSTYIWNKMYVFQIAEDLRKITPDLVIGFGGPEVSWSCSAVFSESSAVNLIMIGEGEQTAVELLSALYAKEPLLKVPGLCIRGTGLPDSGLAITYTEQRSLLRTLDDIPNPYRNGFGDINPHNRILYYESSRGCPYSCAYCLSSIDHTVRFYSLERVLEDIGFFLDEKIPLVKFVDRTFNLKPERYLSIWRYIRDHYNGITTFHFEIHASVLTDEAFEVMETLPPGSIQFEIGIQSSNPDTLRLIHRTTDQEILAQNLRRIPSSIHTHVDLIAGLPGEDFSSFKKSFDFAFSFQVDMVQLGFLKILAGTEMERIAKTGGYAWSSRPPYEVLSSPDLSFDELIILKEIDHLVDTLFNSGLMVHTVRCLARLCGSAFTLFEYVSKFVRTWFPDSDLFLPRRPADLFSCIASAIETLDMDKNGSEEPVEWLRYDFLLQGKPGSFPAWFLRRYDKAAHDDALVAHNLLEKGQSRRSAYSRSEFDQFAFTPDNPSQPVLFVYPPSGSKEKKAQVLFL